MSNKLVKDYTKSLYYMIYVYNHTRRNDEVDMTIYPIVGKLLKCIDQSLDISLKELEELAND